MRLFAVIVALVLMPPHLRAAEITLVQDRTFTFEEIEAGACSLRLGGRIEAGDAARLKQMLEDLFPLEFDDRSPSLCLDSPGGSLDEGVKLAQILAGHFTATVVPQGGECLSACAVAFMGGTFGAYEDIYNMRLIHPSARLGFHAPRLEIGEGNYTAATVSRAFDIAVDAMARIAGDLDHTHLGTPINRFPRSLMAEMLVHRGEDFLEIDTIEKAAGWDIWVITDKRPSLNKGNLIRSCKGGVRWLADDPRMEFAVNDWELEGEWGEVRTVPDGWAVQFGELFTIDCAVRETGGGAVLMRIEMGGVTLGQMPLRPWMAFPADMPIRELR
ncbi:hypothetical protein [Mameliella sediminis]|uniref:COG3904 family protein n=1 Tax=Mameliella sediminis TaxID=2836866 RepID=UPI001C4431AF|nr:hypothetical protein [Mameliella sediminis]MBV7393590.1 hypothetical protein [Mameliella sediminis]